jgi:hypothetical protein
LQVLDWFGKFGFRIPFGVSIADYILDISLGEAGYSSSGNTGNAAVTELYTAFEQQYAGKANAHKHNTGFSYKQPQQISNGTAAAAGALPMSHGGAVNGSSSDAVVLADGSSGSGKKGSISSGSKGEKQKRVGAYYWDQLVVLSQVCHTLYYSISQSVSYLAVSHHIPGRPTKYKTKFAAASSSTCIAGKHVICHVQKQQCFQRCAEARG